VAHLRQDRICFGVMAMVFYINVFNQAAVVVFIPLWADKVLGSAVGVGAVLGAAGLGLVLGNLVFTIFATKVPRYATFTLGFLLGGPPRFLVLGLTDNLTVVLVVTFLAGCALSAVNPVIGLLLFERTPAALQARVFGLVTAIAWAGLPLGGLLAGWAVTVIGLRPALVVTAVAYLAVALTPVIRHRTWRLINRAPDSKTEPAPDSKTERVPDRKAEPIAATEETVDATAG
jgi:MFS family permease